MSKNSKEAGWWPPNQTLTAEIIAKVLEANEKSSSYFRDPMLSFPGTPWHPIVLEVFRAIGSEHANNIGMHTSEGCSEKGFEGTQDLEREVIYWLATQLGSKNPVELVDGFFVPGATGGAQQALWMGRNKILRNNPEARILVITSALGHNSVAKAANLCGLTNKISQGRHSFRTVGINPDGSMNMFELGEVVKTSHADGFIIVPTLGTTLNGAADDVEAIWKVCQLNLAPENFWIHLDAAFGGLVYPFLYPGVDYLSWVHSCVVDFHKMGFAPYGSGAFICRKNAIQETTGVKVEYINNAIDGTVNGSRSAVIPVACWAIIQALGIKGFTEISQYCFGLAKQLETKMRGLRKVAGVTQPVINQLAVALKREFPLDEKLAQDLCLATMTLPWPLGSREQPHQFVKFPVMPHARLELYEPLLQWLDE